jgi:uncharacterized protein (TIGR02145 family)
MRLYIYYIISLSIIYSIGCQNKPASNNQTLADSAKASAQQIVPAAFKKGGDITDEDGNVYHTIIIGKQVWMAENLKVTHYANGDEIPQVADDKRWRQLTAGAYCNYDNNIANADVYGRLYNWHTITDSRHIAPKGWHIPTDQEWRTLIAYLGGNAIAGSKLMAAGLNYWEQPNNTATNQSGFSAIPAGNRNNNGAYDNKGFSATWWTATGEQQADFATNYSVVNNRMAINEDVDDRVCGLSIRCIKD